MFHKAEAVTVVCEDGVRLYTCYVFYFRTFPLLLVFPYLNVVQTGFTPKGIQGCALYHQADAPARQRKILHNHP